MSAALSSLDRPAIERSISIASQDGARLLFLHVISEHVPAILRERVAHVPRQKMEVVIATARVVDRQSIDIQIEIGQSAEKIISTADQINADLIVFGMHQDAGIKDDNSETMIEKSRPVRSSTCADHNGPGIRSIRQCHDWCRFVGLFTARFTGYSVFRAWGGFGYRLCFTDTFFGFHAGRRDT